MGFDRRFTLGLIGWIGAMAAAILAAIASFLMPDLGAARIVALIVVIGMAGGLWHHVTRTNLTLARFVEAMRFGDLSARFEGERGAGFGQLGRAIDTALDRLRERQDQIAGELRYLEALTDDMPVALLAIDAEGSVRPSNKAARRLFRHLDGARPQDFAEFGSTFVRRLAEPKPGEELLLLNIEGRAQRVLLRSATLDRLGLRTWALTLQPIQNTLDAVEMATQTDLVRVLTHEILNSLTPVTSLASTASALLSDPELAADPRIADARLAVTTMARRAEGLGHFIEAYRAIARPPELRRQTFAAGPWAAELARLFAADWPEMPLTLEVSPSGHALDADPDLLAQVAINLLRNAAQALDGRADPRVSFRILGEAGRTRIEVADNGPGIPLGLRQDIFLPFFTTRAAGTGVGLNLARQIIVAHGGAIDVDDAPGGGAAFRILL